MALYSEEQIAVERHLQVLIGDGIIDGDQVAGSSISSCRVASSVVAADGQRQARQAVGQRPAGSDSSRERTAAGRRERQQRGQSREMSATGSAT